MSFDEFWDEWSFLPEDHAHAVYREMTRLQEAFDGAMSQWRVVDDQRAILREALERISLIAVESYPSTIMEYEGDMNRIITYAQNALLRAGRGEAVTRESHTNRDDSPKPEGRSCEGCKWVGWTPAAPSGEGKNG